MLSPVSLGNAQRKWKIGGGTNVRTSADQTSCCSGGMRLSPGDVLSTNFCFCVTEICKDCSSLDHTQYKQTKFVFPSWALIDLWFLLNNKVLVTDATQRPQRKRTRKEFNIHESTELQAPACWQKQRGPLFRVSQQGFMRINWFENDEGMKNTTQNSNHLMPHL